MKKLFLLFLGFSLHFCSSAQQWISMMKDPSINYYEVENKFHEWQDSLQRVDQRSFLFRLLHNEKIKEQNELREEAAEHFYHWAAEIINEIDENGNRLSPEILLQQIQSWRKPNGSNQVQQVQGNWISRGPDSIRAGYGNLKGIGRLANMVIDPNDSMTIYVGTMNSGLWKSTDEGGHWAPLVDSLSGMNINMLAIDPLNSNVLYKVVVGRLLKSTDGGINWSLPGLSFGHSVSGKILIDPVNTQTIFIYANGAGLFKSYDGGSNWDTLSTDYFSDIEFKPGNSSTLFGLQAGYNFMRSTDGGSTFDSVTYLITTNACVELGVTEADSNYVYVYAPNSSGYGGQVALSTDGGSTFLIQPYNSGAPSNWGDLYRFGVSQTDKNFLVQGGMTLSSSTDAGITWNEVTRYFYNAPPVLPYVHPDVRYLLCKGSSIWACHDGGLDKSEDGGLTWMNKSKGLSSAIFYSLACSESDTSVFMSGGIDNALTIHTDSGWANIFSGDGFDAAINPVNPLLVFGKNQYGYQRSFDGGVTAPTTSFFIGLNENTYSFTASFPIRFNQQNPNSLYLLVGNVWKSTDNGDTLVKISSFTSGGGGGFLYVCDVDSNIIFTHGYRTTDGGVTWTIMNRVVMAVDPDEPAKVWAAGAYNGGTSIFFSSDTGNTWQVIPSLDIPFGNDYFMCCANNAEDGIFFINKAGIYYKDNLLSNWQLFTTGLPAVYVSDMKSLSSFGKVRIATLGRGVWESDATFNYSLPPLADFVYDKDSICPGDTIHFFDNSLSNGPGYNPVYQWSFPGGTPSVSSDPYPIVVYNTSGIFDISLTIVNSNGSDSITKTTAVSVSSAPLTTLPLSEDFENAVFPPLGWNWNSGSIYRNWTRSTFFGGYALSTKSLAYFAWTTAGQEYDYFNTPNLDLSSIPDPVLIFDYCYPYDYVDADTLKIFYSFDCGFTRNYIFAKGGLDLKTDSCYTTYAFSPDSTSWRTDTVSLYAFAQSGDIQLGFEVNSKTRCEVYIDNINISSVAGVGTPEIPPRQNALTVFPNPSSGEINITWNGNKNDSGKLMLLNALGEEVWSSIIYGSEQIHLSQPYFPNGIYTILLDSDHTLLNRKLVILN